MKENKDRNRVVFGPSYKDLEEQARTDRRERKFGEFEVDLRLDLGGVPEITTPTFPTFSGPGVLPDTSINVQDFPAKSGPLYVDLDGDLGYGQPVVLGLSTVDSWFVADGGGENGWPQPSLSDIGVITVTGLDGTIFPPLTGSPIFKARTFAVVGGVVYAASYQLLQFWDGTNWVDISPSLPGTAEVGPYFSVFSYDEVNGRYYIMAYFAETSEFSPLFNSPAYIFLGYIDAVSGVVWNSGITVVRGPVGVGPNSAGGYFNGKAKYGFAYWVFGTSPSGRKQGGCTFSTSTLEFDVSSFYDFDGANPGTSFSQNSSNISRAYSTGDIDFFGRLILPARIANFGSGTFFHNPAGNNTITVHDLLNQSRFVRTWEPADLSVKVDKSYPVHMFGTPAPDNRFLVAGKVQGQDSMAVWESRLPLNDVSDAAIQSNTRVIFQTPTLSDPNLKAVYLSGFYPAPEWPFYAFTSYATQNDFINLVDPEQSIFRESKLYLGGLPPYQ